MLLFFEFQIGPYTATFWILLIWIATIILTIILNKFIKRMLKRHLKKPNIKIKGTRITILKVLNQLLIVGAFVAGFQAFRISNKIISIREFLSYDIIPKVADGKFHISMMDVLTIFFVFAISRFLINIFRLYIDRRFKDNDDFDEGTRFVYIQFAKYIIYVFAVIFSLQIVFTDLSGLVVGSAAIFAALALGLQGMFRDMVSGIVLLFEGTIKVGDIVRLFSPVTGEEIIGRVLKINVRTAKVETRDGNTLVIPNSLLTQDQIENWTFSPGHTRFHITLRIAYGTDTELVKKLLKQAALSHPEVSKKKPVTVRILNFGEYALEMELLFWANQKWFAEYYKSEIRFEIDRLFKQNGIKIPFPQRTIHMANENRPEYDNVKNPEVEK
ncbi:mechanosensitive ion channel [Brumimicrobium glaciale]|jgi:small-conductance mechanosensitive channel|uniref:Mechanosensitive ion channel n=1 Tax=Brumimicrobium glaciale TaxID=200475 RepID=A0A4V1WF87_9FLAO|nr:mechanosensitive ion channel domain-containing protein [Brumimicrobium glaciale]RYM32336.1 mechanosensitive ion channel [Brumimicrobium glaciale]